MKRPMSSFVKRKRPLSPARGFNNLHKNNIQYNNLIEETTNSFNQIMGHIGRYKARNYPSCKNSNKL